MAVDTGKVMVIVGGVALVGAGVYFVMRTSPGHKKPGDTVTAKITFRYQGTGPVWVGFGLVPHELLGHGKVETFFHVLVPLPVSATMVSFKAPDLSVVLPVLPPGDYDALLFIQTVNGELSTNAKFLDWAWKDKAIIID